MIKRRISIVLIIVLVITLVIVSFKYNALLDEHNWQQTNVNIEFKKDLRCDESKESEEINNV